MPRRVQPNPDALPAQRDEQVEAFLAELEHPCKAGIFSVREIILSADASVGEGIKWNAPSFRVRGIFFATFHLRPRDRVQLILHFGAKVRSLPSEFTVPDPAGLLQWLAKDRATVIFANAAAITRRRESLRSLVQAWITFV